MVYCLFNIPADAVGSMSKLEKLFSRASKMLNINKFIRILKVCSVIFMAPFQLTLIFLSHTLYACLHTWSDSDASVLSLCCLTGMFYRIDHMCVLLLKNRSSYDNLYYHIFFFFQLKGKLWLYNYFYNRCRPLCLGSTSLYLLSSLLSFSLIFGYYFLTYSCSSLACLLFLSCVSLGEGLMEVT